MLAAFVPIWLLTGLGWLAGRYRLLGPDADRVLGGFVFYLAMPAALFTAVATRPLTVEPRALGVFAVSTVVTMTLGFLLAGPVLRRTGPRPGVGEATIAGMLAGYVNAGNLGIPVVLVVLGDAAFLTGVLFFQVLVVTPVILTLLDRGTGRRLRPTRVLTLPVRNPVLIGLSLGALVSSTGWRVPDLLAEPLAVLGAAAVPAALVTLGLSLTTRGPSPSGEGARVALLSGLKLLLQPALAWLIGLLVGLSPAQLLAVVVCAALPAAQNTYIYAREYGQAASLARRSIITSTAFSMVTLAVITWWLG